MFLSAVAFFAEPPSDTQASGAREPSTAGLTSIASTPISTANPSPLLTTPGTVDYVVLLARINVRAKPDSNSAWVRFAVKDEALHVVKLENGWAQLLDGTYVFANYIHAIPANTLPSTPNPTLTANPGAAQPPVVGQGTNCIEGNIINTYEVLQGGDAWSITIKASTAPGITLDQVTANLNGSFHFPSLGKPPLGAGTYIVTLKLPLGWQPFTPTEFAVTLNGNTNVNCARVRFKVEALANLTVTKLDSVGMVGIAGWTFIVAPQSIPGAVIQSAVTDGLGNAYFLNLPPGVWKIEEKQQNGWQLVPGYSNPRVITLVSPQRPGNYQKLTFVNKQVKSDWILVEKKDTLGNPLPGWTFTLTTVDGKQPPQIAITNTAGQYYFQGLLPGKWSVTETTRSPWWRSVSPDPQAINLSPPAVGQQVEFVNEPLGCVDGYKINHLEKALPGWTIKAYKTSGNAEDQAIVTDSKGYFQFYLSLGTWTISEELQDGWSAVTPTEFSVPVTKQYVCEHVRFKNRTDYACIDAYKKDISDGVGLPGWHISLRPEYGTATQTGVTDGTGWVRFNKLTPGVYRIWEIPQVGWTQRYVKVGYLPGSLPIAPLNADHSTTITLEANGSCKTVEHYNIQNNKLGPATPANTDP